MAGYDLTRLLTGSEGTLGVLTEVTRRAAAHAGHRRNTGVAYFPTLADAGRAVGAIIGDGIVPATLEFLDAKCIGAVEEYAHLGLRDDAGALLLFGDDGAGGRRRPQPGPHRRAVCTATGAIEVTLAENIARAAGAAGGAAVLAAGAVAAGDDDDPGGRDGAPAAAGRDGRPDRRDRRTRTTCRWPPSGTPATATCTRRSWSTSTTTPPSSGPTRRSARSSRRRSRWAARSPASTGWARRSCRT